MVALFSKISVNLRWAFFVRISYKYNVVGNIDIDRHLSTSSITSIRLHSHLIASSLDKVLPCVLLTNAININAPDLYSSECDLAWAAFLSSSVTCTPTSLSPPFSRIGNIVIGIGQLLHPTGSEPWPWLWLWFHHL